MVKFCVRSLSISTELYRKIHKSFSVQPAFRETAEDISLGMASLFQKLVII